METYVTGMIICQYFFNVTLFLALLDNFCNFLTPSDLPLDLSYHLVKTDSKNINPFKSYGDLCDMQ